MFYKKSLFSISSIARKEKDLSKMKISHDIFAEAECFWRLSHPLLPPPALSSPLFLSLPSPRFVEYIGRVQEKTSRDSSAYIGVNRPDLSCAVKSKVVPVKSDGGWGGGGGCTVETDRD